ncbi:DUF6168 family protein [Thalassobellus suaedae]|uniref:DUF6168 family protein n=1 Tax=Thalassobellus suaedae TaxID=3074124 RepID=A0ABY9XS05_9FLAO|nr:DUF6168 family protein [Flavobacteriaceae bacterium HL-DH14]WNH13951.1 DUF6168 family protein [Flavobacteriaceae bacterium HL-DH10]
MILKNSIIKCLIVVGVAAIAFFIHLLVNNLISQSFDTNQLIYSYCINVVLACSAILVLFLLKKKLKDQLGFIFMGASMLKFVFFFLLLYPEYNSDGNLSRLEFFTFFIPYVVCLITESIILSKFLNDLDDFS